MPLADHDDAFANAKPFGAAISGKCLELLSTPTTGDPIRRKDHDEEGRRLQRLIDLGVELRSVCNSFVVAPDLWAVRPEIPEFIAKVFVQESDEPFRVHHPGRRGVVVSR